MNHARFTAIHAGMTSVAKKVYEVTPIAESWSAGQICQELLRTGSSVDPRVISGCISALVHAGIVLQQGPDAYRRTPVRPKPERAAPLAQPETMAKPTPTTTPPPAVPAAAKLTDPAGPIDKLGALSSRVSNMVELLQALAIDIDTAALEIEEQIQAKNAETAKLRQLQALLREMA